MIMTENIQLCRIKRGLYGLHFLLAAILMIITYYWVTPRIYNKIGNYFLSYIIGFSIPLCLLLVWALIAFSLEKKKNPELSFTDRMRLEKLTKQDLGWTVHNLKVMRALVAYTT